MPTDAQLNYGHLKRSDMLLVLISEKSTIDTDGVCFVPRADAEYIQRLDYMSTTVYGAGDARSLDTMVKKGLIREVRLPHSRFSKRPFGYRITEDGQLRVEAVVNATA